MKCEFIKQDNNQCKANAVTGSKFCFRHDPNLQKEKNIASSRGGLNRRLEGKFGQNIKLDNSGDIKSFIGDVINKVWTGKVPVKVGTSMGFLAKCWVEIHQTTVIEKKIDKLEQKIIKKGL